MMWLYELLDKREQELFKVGVLVYSNIFKESFFIEWPYQSD